MPGDRVSGERLRNRINNQERDVICVKNTNNPDQPVLKNWRENNPEKEVIQNKPEPSLQDKTLYGLNKLNPAL